MWLWALLGTAGRLATAKHPPKPLLHERFFTVGTDLRRSSANARLVVALTASGCRSPAACWVTPEKIARPSSACTNSPQSVGGPRADEPDVAATPRALQRKLLPHLFSPGGRPPRLPGSVFYIVAPAIRDALESGFPRTGPTTFATREGLESTLGWLPSADRRWGSGGQTAAGKVRLCIPSAALQATVGHDAGRAQDDSPPPTRSTL